MLNIFKKIKDDSKKGAEAKSGVKRKQVIKKKAPTKKAPNLEAYCVAATLYGEAGTLDNEGITRVAETIRNRYDYYNKNKAAGVDKISYRDIVAAPNQYTGFDKYKRMNLKNFKDYEKNLSEDEKKNWNRCMKIARKLVDGKLKTDYARGALGFNKASVASNKKMFNTTLAFKDTSKYADNPKKSSPHVFFGDFYLSPLKDAKGKLLAKGGNPKQDNLLLAQSKKLQAQNG